MVEETCREFGVRYAVAPRPSGRGSRSHFRWLRRMGQADASVGREVEARRERAGGSVGR